MELPDDVLALIREFSKPCFRDFREYNCAKMVLGDQWSLWTELKVRLQTDERVLSKLVMYVNAVIHRKKVRQTLHDHVRKHVFEEADYAERARLHDLLYDCRHREHHLHRFLMYEFPTPGFPA